MIELYDFSTTREGLCPNVQNVIIPVQLKTDGTLAGRGINASRVHSNLPEQQIADTPQVKKPQQFCCDTLGLSLNCIARMFKVSTPAVLRWVRLFAEKTYEKPEPSEAVIVELDEMWHYLGSKKTNFGYGKLIVAVPVSSLIGNVGIVIKKRSHV
jgi:hypothetical protein